MDEHEIRAFELELILTRTRGTANLIPAYKTALEDSIKNHRELSKTYTPYEGPISSGRLRNTS